MKPLRNLKKIIFLLLLILYSAELAQAGEQITLSPDGGHSNQEQINKALEKGDVYLEAGVYEVDNTIIIGSNRVLSGDSNAIIRVYSGSAQWFTGLKGVISCEDVVHDVEISGFQIDGNIGNLPKSYADSRSDTSHDCEKLIILHGYSASFASNIKIHDLKLYDSFSDGIYILFADQVSCYDNVISNCQHEGIYLSCVKNGLFYSNKIAGITSDAGRLDNCVNCKVFSNLFFSYTGESYGAWAGGQSGLQVADSGASMGYDGSKKPQTTTNIEVYDNTFSSPGLRAVWLDSTGKGVTNVYIHDNSFVGVSGIETDGTPVDVISSNNVSVEGISFENVSVDNPPTLEMSEKIFSSIFDILDVDFTDTGLTNQTAEDIHYSVEKTESGRIAGGIKIIGFKDLIYIEGVPYIPNNESVLVKYEAVKAPSFSWDQNGVSKIEKDVDLKNENGNITATLTVKMKWFKLSTDSTGSTKKKYKTSKAVFSDTVKAPQILDRPSEQKGILYDYPTYAVAYVSPDGLTRVEYEYDGKTVEHVFLLGEQHRTENGIIYTNFSNVNYWKGDLPHSGEFLYINGSFDPEKLTVTAYTPYENFSVAHFDYVKKDYPVKFFADWLFPSFGLFLILWFGAWYYIRKILY